QIQDYYQRFATQLAEVGFAQDEDSFLARMKKIKKQGFYLSHGELDPNVSGLSVPIKLSTNKESPLALTIVASKNRFEFIHIEKLIEILKSNAAQIEHKFLTLSQNERNPVNSLI
ncbi:MAG TPA: transcriptional regulator, partial [Acinetobacter ursingii]|nr:transcriptional regulator [Acinetobacter ursingii]